MLATILHIIFASVSDWFNVIMPVSVSIGQSRNNYVGFDFITLNFWLLAEGF